MGSMCYDWKSKQSIKSWSDLTKNDKYMRLMKRKQMQEVRLWKSQRLKKANKKVRHGACVMIQIKIKNKLKKI